MKKALFVIVVAVLVISLALPSALVGASPNSGTVGLWHLDEGSEKTAYDSSGLSNDGTLSGGRFGGALSFDGVGDYVACGAAVDDSITTGVTLEAWIKPAVKQNGGIISNDYTLGNEKGYDFFLWAKGSNGRLYIDFGNGSDCGRTYWAIPGADWYGYWHHVAATWDGSTVRLYVDGSEVGTTPLSGTYSSPTKDTLIGGINYLTPPYCSFDGIIDEVRISNVAYTTFDLANPPSVILGETVALWHFDSDADDSSGNDNNGTIYGASWIPAGPTWTSGLFDGALSFDGVDDYVEIPHTTSLDITDQIAVEAWINLDTVDKNDPLGGTIIRKGAWPIVDPPPTWGFDIKWGKLRAFIYDEDSPYIANGATVLSAGVWYAVAFTYDGSELQIYLNGVPDGSPTSHMGDIDSTSASVWIGRKDQVDFFHGTIDEVRIWNTASPSFGLEASPDTAFNPIGTTHTVTATVTPAVEGVPVVFEVTSGPDAGSPKTVYTDPNGEAELIINNGLNGAGEDVITVSLANGYAEDPVAAPDSIVVYKYWLENFVTGGGNIKDGRKPAWTFAGTVGVLTDVGIVGQFQIVDHTVKKGETWHCNDFSSLDFSGDPIVGPSGPSASHTTATFTGTFNSNRGNQAELTVTIQDLGEPGAGIDKIEVSEVSNGLTVGPQAIDGGNFQVHDIE